MKLDRGYVWLLKIAPLPGPRPGSNFWPELCVKDEQGIIDENDRAGERIEDLVRAGYLAANERPPGKVDVVNKGCAEAPDLPEIELTHDYHLTPAGANAVAMFEGGLK